MTTRARRAGRPAVEAPLGLPVAGWCARVPSEERRREERDTYHKGWEIRIYVASAADAATVAATLSSASISTGRAYRKSAHRWIVPVYGRRAVEQVRALLEPGDRTADSTT